MRNDSEREDQLDKVKKFLLHESWLTQNIIKAKLHGENTQQIAENLKVSQAKINNAYSRFVKRFQKINGIS
jgi:N12 class adenine-specific DNA methylase